MLFVRCGNNGISHHPDETMTAEDADVATSVLLHFFEHFDAAGFAAARRWIGDDRPPASATRGTTQVNPYDALHRWIDAHHPEQIEFLRALVRVPSDTPPGDNAPAAEKAAELLAAMDFTVERHPVPADLLRAHGMKSVTNLIVRQRFGTGGPTIALNAHGDVVPPGEGWTRPPYDGVIENGRMYGRGVAVSKSDIATFTYALAALRALPPEGTPLNGIVELHFTYDEEFGGLAGPGFLLDRKLTKPDFAIAASFSYAVVTAHNGCLQLEVTVHGKSGHGAMPETGRDAFRAGTAILNAIYAEADALAAKKSQVRGIDHPTMIVGLMSGGINTNVVPDRLTLKLDRRMTPEEDPAEVEAQVRAMIEACGARPRRHPGRDPAPAACERADAAARSREARGGDPAPRPAPYSARTSPRPACRCMPMRACTASTACRS